MRDQIEKAIAETIATLFQTDIKIELSRPEEQYGDWSTSVALQLAGQLKQSPDEIAKKIAQNLKSKLSLEIDSISLKNNFINLRLSDANILKTAASAPNYRPTLYQNQTVVAEYSDPNPFKILHAGHFYTSVIGDSVASLLEMAGANVKRVNFGGDVGLHVAKTMWAIITEAGSTKVEDFDVAWAEVQKHAQEPLIERANWLTDCYVLGNKIYLADEAEAKSSIAALNKQIYQLIADDDRTSPLAQAYWTCRSWSYEYFKAFYQEIEVTPFDKYYPESQTAELGLKVVKENLAKGVFEKSDGAIVFNGEKYGLHTRVFISSQGLPTYEAKDIGLIMHKWHDFKFDKSIIITSNDQAEYMKVVLKSLEQIDPELAKKSVHLTHGIVKLKGGEKMSSRLGNILRADSLIEATDKASQKKVGRSSRVTTLGAIKYVFLKHRLGADIFYDPDASVSLVGNSGPYLQYAHARARSILSKLSPSKTPPQTDLEPSERTLARKISEYPDALDKAINEFMPHHICNYIYELAQVFNSFYENNRVSGDSRQNLRASLVESYADTLRTGLKLLNIDAPDHL